MQTQGFGPKQNSPLILPGANLVVPKAVADQRNVEHSTVKTFFRLKGFLPNHDFVLVETIYDYQPEEPSQVVIPDEVKNRQKTCKVIAVGKGGMMPNGNVNVPAVKKGDYVFCQTGKFEKLTAADAPGREFQLVHDSAILGIFGQNDDPNAAD